MKKKHLFKRTMAYIVTIVMVIGLMNGFVLKTTVKAGVTLLWPVPGHKNITQGYTSAFDPKHHAIDISDGNIWGARIVAAYSGKVYQKFECPHNKRCGDNNGFGTGLVILGDDNRYYTYGHMLSGSIPKSIKVGTRVTIGTQIGQVGCSGNVTGTHLHFLITKNQWFDTSKYAKYGYVNNTFNPEPGKETYVDNINIKPDPPTNVRLNKTDIGLGDSITVSWNKSARASSYNVNLVCPQNTANNQSRSVGGTSTSFSIKKAGTYKVNVSAKNSAGTSAAVSTGNCVVHNNVTVKYVDWDDVVLKTQSVKWGGNATAPAAPSREGYTFQSWSSDGKNVKSDITIKAQYKINTYSVSFVDYNGNVIGSVQRVEHGSAATPPTNVPTKEGYVFSEWSTKEYEKVTKALTVRAIYVWENVNLPIITKIISAKRNNEATGYDVDVKLSNFPNDFTKGKLVATLKTKQGKMVASEIKSISMPTEGEVTEHFTILYSGLAPRVDVSMIGVIDDETTGTPKSKIVTSAVDIGNNWSDWSATVPTGQDIISDSRPEYRFKDTQIIKAIAQPATPTGYSLLSKDATGTYTAWGAWSAWSDTKITGNTLKEVGTQSVPKSYKTQYNYSRWASNSNNTGHLGPVKGTWGGVYCGYYFEKGWSDTKLAVSGTQYSAQVGGNFNLYGNNQWFNQKTRSVAASYKTQYRYRTRSEYFNYKYKQDEFSAWQPEQVVASDTREVETRTAYRFKTNSTEVPCYNYKRYRYTNLNSGKIIYSYTSSYADSMDFPGEWEYKQEFTELNKISDVDEGIELYNGTGEDSWYKADVNNESDSTVFETSKSLEDQTGVKRNLKGKVEGAAGKVATLMIYKGKNEDPIASQIEFIGQTVIAEDGSYEFNYVTKEEPSLLTGDFVITLGIEGSTNYVNIGKIEAPKKIHSVDFIDEDGTAIGERKSVVDGGTVEAPEAPEKEGLEFVGWDTGLRNIRENTVIKPIYRKKIYTVIFIDWDATDVGIREFEYGDKLEAPEKELEKEGQIFDKWVNEDDEEVEVVTQNMIVTASYKDTKYSVKFLDWDGNVISEQEVEYGEEAQTPDLGEAPSDMVFDKWDSEGQENYVTKDLVVSPVAKYVTDSSTPTLTVPSGTYSDTQSVGMYSLQSNTDIYYLVADEDSADAEVLYLGEELFERYENPVEVDKNSVVFAYAKTENKNRSEIVSSVIKIGEEETSTQEDTTTEEPSTTAETTTEAPTSTVVPTTTVEPTTTVMPTTTVEQTTTKEPETPVVQPPVKPAGLQGIVDKSDNYNLFWVSSEGALYYNIYVNGESVGNTVSTNYRIPASFFNNNGTYKIEVEAVNNAGTSEKAFVEYVVDKTEPTTQETQTTVEPTTVAPTTTAESTTTKSKPIKPTNLQGVVDKNDNYNAYWTASEGASYYQVYVNGELVGNTVSANYRIPASYFTKNGEYTIEVEAVNSVGTSDKTSATYLVQIEETTKAPEVTTSEVTTPEITTTEVTTPDATTQPVETTDSVVVPTTKEQKTEKPTVKPTEKTTTKVTVAKPSIKKLINKKKKKVIVKWKMSLAPDGYHVQCALNKKFTKKLKNKKVKNIFATKATFKKLKRKKTYYFRMRAYKQVGGIKYYSLWSPVKRIKISK